MRAEDEFGQQRAASGTWFVESGPFLRRRPDDCQLRQRAREAQSAPLGRADGAGRSGHAAVRRFHLDAGGRARDLRHHPADVRQRTPAVQLEQQSLGTNIRLRWEYLPGSELFVAYNEGRSTLQLRGFADLQNRSFVVKVNRLFRF
jgi:hypothetical protein